jgi:DNA repair exonuclease SbcCD ATPase subunit
LSLGGTAGLAGGISIAAVGLNLLFEYLGRTGEQSKITAENLNLMTKAIQATASNISEMKKEDLDGAIAGIEAAHEAAEALKQKFVETRKADAEFATAALSNAGKVTQAQKNIAAALGLQVDSLRELSALAEAEAEKRKLATQQSIDAENQRLANAKDTAREKANLLGDLMSETDVIKENLKKEREKLDTLREQRDALTEIANAKNPHPGGTPFDPPSKMFEARAFYERKEQAKSQLELPSSKAQLEGQQGIIDAIESKISELIKPLTGTLAKAERGLDVANNQVVDLEGAVSENIERLTQTLAADDLLARSKTLVETGQQFATEIKTAVSKIEAGNQAQEEAKEVLLRAAEGGVIAQNEQRGVADSMRTLIGGLQSGISATNGNTQALIRLIEKLQTEQTNQAMKIQSLSSR